MKIIYLTQGKATIVDDGDYEWINQWKWYYNGRYAVRTIRLTDGGRVTIFMHRVILNPLDEMFTDHINHDRLDNRRSNLRACTRSQNLANSVRATNNRSGKKGVTWDKQSNKWISQVGYHRKHINLGRFDKLEDAASAYQIKAKELFGEFYNE
jgi:hypothetical protein